MTCVRYDTISFADFDASVKGWVNHVRFADTWGLRKHVFRRLAAHKKARAAADAADQ